MHNAPNSMIYGSLPSVSTSKDESLVVLPLVIEGGAVVLCFEAAKILGLIDVGFDSDAVKIWAPVNIIFYFIKWSGAVSTRYAAAPLLMVVKFLATVAVSDGEQYFLGTTVNNVTIAAMSLPIIGACYAAVSSEMQVVTVPGLVWLAIHCCAIAGYVLYLHYAVKKAKLSKMEMVYCNYALSLLFTTPALLVGGELDSFMDGESSTSAFTFEHMFWGILAGVVNAFSTYFGLHCIDSGGPITYALTVSLTKVPTILMGYMFGGFQVSDRGWMFILFCVVAGLVYFNAPSSTVLLEARTPRKTKATPKPDIDVYEFPPEVTNTSQLALVFEKPRHRQNPKTEPSAREGGENEEESLVFSSFTSGRSAPIDIIGGRDEADFGPPPETPQYVSFGGMTPFLPEDRNDSGVAGGVSFGNPSSTTLHQRGSGQSTSFR